MSQCNWCNQYNQIILESCWECGTDDVCVNCWKECWCGSERFCSECVELCKKCGYSICPDCIDKHECP